VIARATRGRVCLASGAGPNPGGQGFLRRRQMPRRRAAFVRHPKDVCQPPPLQWVPARDAFGQERMRHGS